MIEEEAKMSMKEEEDFEGKQRMEQNNHRYRLYNHPNYPPIKKYTILSFFHSPAAVHKPAATATVALPLPPLRCCCCSNSCCSNSCCCCCCCCCCASAWAVLPKLDRRSRPGGPPEFLCCCCRLLLLLLPPRDDGPVATHTVEIRWPR